MLALGDSYTIGQSVPAAERWPAQLRDSLLARGISWDTLEIIAVTGWRTDNLANAMNARNLDSTYNLVSLLIGVNDQFQGGDTASYAPAFESLLRSAIGLAQGDTHQVMVLSIPDYAYTPFGQGSNPAAISKGIDDFNAVNKRISAQYGVAYYNITPISREGVARPALVANDGLHPSGLQYSEWVSLILDSLQLPVPASLSDQTVPDWHIFPNPMVGHLQLDVPSAATIQVFNGQGVCVHQQVGNARILTEKWPVGMYVVRVASDKKVYTTKVMKL